VNSELRRTLADFAPRTADASDRRLAAVGLVLGRWSSDVPISFLLLERSASLASHASQYGLPGGKLHPGESFEDAVLREAKEEVDLDLAEGDIVGRLDDYITRSGYLIRPFVLWFDGDMRAEPDPGEIACLMHIPVTALSGPGVPTLLSYPGADRPVIQLPLGGERTVHAPTGAILYQFARWFFDGVRVRNDDYEEPTFAWE